MAGDLHSVEMDRKNGHASNYKEGAALMARSWKIDDRVMSDIINDDKKRDRWLGGIAFQMVANIILSMQQSPATGRVYQRGNKTHTASSPGNPPRIDFGSLVNSIKAVRLSMLKWAIQTDVLHGLETELGVGMQARPWMRPEFVRMAKQLPAQASGGKLL
jgi:hypothetical protein